MKILVVDDEILAREDIVTSLNALGYTDICEAKDGIEAYDIIENIKPEIVIADIRMPGIDGLELLSLVKKFSWDIIFVFFSGFNLFEYAQKAITLGAFSYLLKPVKNSELAEVMKSAIQKLEDAKNQFEISNEMSIKIKNSLEFMKQHFILSLVTQNPLPLNNLTGKFKELGIKLNYKGFCIIIVCIDSNRINCNNIQFQEKELIYFTIENIASKILSNNRIVSYTFQAHDDMGFLLNFETVEEHEYHEIIEGGSKIKKNVDSYIGGTVSMGIGSIVNDITFLNKSYLSAQQALEQKLVKGIDQIFIFQNVSEQKDYDNVISFKAEQEFLKCFEKCEKESLMALMHNLYNPLINSSFIDTNNFKKVNLQLILLIYKILKQMSINPETVLDDEFAIYSEVNTCENMEAIFTWFDNKIDICFNAIHAARAKGNKKLLEKSKKYIFENIAKDITLDAVADHVHLSPSYFSRMFKRETGENYVDYVINLRISMARELIKEGVYKASDVSKMTGFNDVRRFYKVFKKMTGFTPSEYKDI